jgi:H+/Cl- antiporter ClcA
MTFLVWETLKYPPLAIGVSEHWWYVPVFMLATAAVGLVVYYVARSVRHSQGIDLDLVYQELPPD